MERKLLWNWRAPHRGRHARFRSSATTSRQRAGFGDTRIETRRIAIEEADPNILATGQIRGTPRSALIEKRGVSLAQVIEKVTAALAKTGGNPYSGYAQAVIVEALAI